MFHIFTSAYTKNMKHNLKIKQHNRTNNIKSKEMIILKNNM